MKDDATIFIIEDDVDQATLYERSLARAGFSSYTVHTMEEALNVLGSGYIPAVVVTDIHLPDGDGTQILSHIRNNVAFEQTHVIVVSAPDVIKSFGAMRFQPDNVLVKPVQPKALNIMVREAVNATRRDAV